jgi:hypothetical protein
MKYREALQNINKLEEVYKKTFHTTADSILYNNSVKQFLYKCELFGNMRMSTVDWDDYLKIKYKYTIYFYQQYDWLVEHNKIARGTDICRVLNYHLI